MRAASVGTSMPHLCIQEGLDCITCTGSTARELARACPGLPAKLVAQLFVQIHVHPACARMHRNFTQAYAGALESVRPLAKPAAIETRTPLAATAAA
jgi:hypothetical protein